MNDDGEESDVSCKRKSQSLVEIGKISDDNSLETLNNSSSFMSNNSKSHPALITLFKNYF